jgi:anti-sigma B factor antagonist
MPLARSQHRSGFSRNCLTLDQDEGISMEMQIEEPDGRIARVKLIGRMDHAGVAEIEAIFTAMVARERFLLVDISQVTFLASMGIRALIMAAKTLTERNGKLILFKPELMVAKVLKISGMDALIPIYYDMMLVRIAMKPPHPE